MARLVQDAAIAATTVGIDRSARTRHNWLVVPKGNIHPTISAILLATPQPLCRRATGEEIA